MALACFQVLSRAWSALLARTSLVRDGSPAHVQVAEAGGQADCGDAEKNFADVIRQRFADLLHMVLPLVSGQDAPDQMTSYVRPSFLASFKGDRKIYTVHTYYILHI